MGAATYEEARAGVTGVRLAGLAILAGAVLGSGAALALDVPVQVPLPRERPPVDAAKIEPAVSDEITGSLPQTASAYADANGVALERRGDRLDRAAALRGILADGDDVLRLPLPKPRPIQLASIAPILPAELANVMRKKPRIAPADDAYCLPRLASLGSDFKGLDSIQDGECGIVAPIKLASLGSGDTEVKLTPAATIDCRVGDALSRWMDDVVQPAAQENLGGRVTAVRVAASYHCRTRDNIKGAPLSEHAFGNAIDIAAFRVGQGKAAKWIAVGPREDGAAPDAKFLASIREEACGPFTTVLGPGSDVFHEEHFHLDLAARNRRGKSKGLYCK
jgi:hypothetical protein